MAYTILAFCGGGIRGLLSAGLLSRLYSQFPDIVSGANMLAGTSAGAAIISQLVAKKTPDQIYSAFQNDAPLFFKNPGTNPNAPAYNVDLVVAAERILHPLNPPLTDFPQDLVLTAFNVAAGANGSWTPLLLNNLPKSQTGSTPIVDAVVSSGAMPGMSGSWKGNIDGAFVHHDPTLAAIALAVGSRGVALSDIAVICFGTGFMANFIASDTSTWGAQQWMNGDGNTKNQTPALLVNGTVAPILNATLNGTSTSMVPELSGMLLSGQGAPRYVYLNPVLDRYIAENDVNPADLAYMESLVASFDLTQAIAVVQGSWATSASRGANA